jgi:hypothetical protein
VGGFLFGPGKHIRLWFIKAVQRELRPLGIVLGGEAPGGRVSRRAAQPVKPLTFAFEVQPAALVLGPSPEDPSEFGPTSKGPRRWPSQRLIQWKSESQNILVPLI